MDVDLAALLSYHRYLRLQRREKLRSTASAGPACSVGLQLAADCKQPTSQEWHC